MTGTIIDAYKVLFEAKRVLDKNNIRFWLDGGTLLGFVRDKTFCLDDHNDIDLSCWGDKITTDKIPQLIETFINKGYSIHGNWDWDGKAHELSVIKDGIKVDIFFKERKGEWSWHCLYAGKNPVSWKKNPARYFDELTWIPIMYKENILFEDEHAEQSKERMFQIPKDYNGYLKELYGLWEIPVHRSNWSCYQNGNAFTTKEWVER